MLASSGILMIRQLISTIYTRKDLFCVLGVCIEPKDSFLNTILLYLLLIFCHLFNIIDLDICLG